MTVNGIATQLRTTDLERAIKFYTEILGFKLAFRYEDFYAGIECNGHSIHLKKIDEHDPSIEFVRSEEHLHLYIAVQDVRKVYEDLKKTNAIFIADLNKKPWGAIEFVIEDEDKHTIYFAGSPN
jgi:catechol 2,3-dioxygenase-like lactoylglutathione lyase family enzyme